MDAAALEQVIETDGELAAGELQIDTARMLEQSGPWGQGFPEPLFEGQFEVIDARVLGEQQNHVRYRLRGGGAEVIAMDFGGIERLQRSGAVTVAYRLSVNRWQGNEAVNLHIQHLRSSRPP